MTNSKKRQKQRIMKIRFWIMGILLLFTLSIFCFAIWAGTQYGFTSNTIIYGIILAFMLFVSGFVGGPAVKELIEKNKIKTSSKAQKRHNHIVKMCRREEQ